MKIYYTLQRIEDGPRPFGKKIANFNKIYPDMDWLYKERGLQKEGKVMLSKRIAKDNGYVIIKTMPFIGSVADFMKWCKRNWKKERVLKRINDETYKDT